MEAGWQDIALTPGLRLRSPVQLSPAEAQGVDSNVRAWEGGGGNIEVVVDEGPYADPLTTYDDRPNAHAANETIGGQPARVVSFLLDGWRQFAAAHFDRGTGGGVATGKTTVSVTGRDELGGDVPLKIVRSVRFT
jgi:hypothetical protein